MRWVWLPRVDPTHDNEKEINILRYEEERTLLSKYKQEKSWVRSLSCRQKAVFAGPRVSSSKADDIRLGSSTRGYICVAKPNDTDCVTQILSDIIFVGLNQISLIVNFQTEALNMDLQAARHGLQPETIFDGLGGDIAAWSVEVDAFELGPRVEVHRYTQNLYIAASERDSRLTKMPIEILDEIGKQLRIPSENLSRVWLSVSKCCKVECSHKLCQRDKCIHEQCRAHRQIQQRFTDTVSLQATVFTSKKMPCRTRWQEAIDSLQQEFKGLKIVLQTAGQRYWWCNTHLKSTVKYEAFIILPIHAAPEMRDHEKVNH